MRCSSIYSAPASPLVRRRAVERIAGSLAAYLPGRSNVASSFERDTRPASDASRFRVVSSPRVLVLPVQVERVYRFLAIIQAIVFGAFCQPQGKPFRPFGTIPIVCLPPPPPPPGPSLHDCAAPMEERRATSYLWWTLSMAPLVHACSPRISWIFRGTGSRSCLLCAARCRAKVSRPSLLQYQLAFLGSFFYYHLILGLCFAGRTGV